MMTKEFRSAEFYQNLAAGGSVAAGGWAYGAQNTWAQNGRVAKPGIITLPLNAKLKKRRIYAYLWARASVDPAVHFCYFFCQVNLLLRGVEQISFPLSYAVGTNSLIQILVDYGAVAQPGIQKTFFSLPLAGGIAEGKTIAFQLYDAPISAYNAETQVAQLMQPYELETEADQLRVDVLGWGNMDTDAVRCVIVSVAV